jgi:hypothetical protein
MKHYRPHAIGDCYKLTLYRSAFGNTNVTDARIPDIK